MKSLFLTLIFVMGAALTHQSAAISTAPAPMAKDAMSIASTMTVSDFLAVDFKGYRTAEGKKLKWTQRLAFSMTQKNLAKQVKKGKIEETATMDMAMAAKGRNTFGLLSVIFSVAGLVIPYFGLAMIIAGLVLGIMGIKRDSDPTLAIIGTVISSVFLVLLLLVLVAFASGGWFW